MMAFESCSEGVINDEAMALTPEGTLRVGTRDDDAHSVKDGRIYVMDEAALRERAECECQPTTGDKRVAEGHL